MGTKARVLREGIQSQASSQPIRVVSVVPRVMELRQAEDKSLEVIQRSIQDTPTELHDLYRATIQRIDKANIFRSMQLLQWVSSHQDLCQWQSCILRWP